MSIALFSAITGLNNFQKVLDIVGNNISNIQTPGYKSASITFKELFSQTLKPASASSGSQGGTNPIQVGMGAGIGNIASKFTQGTVELTGRSTDMAITGDGFFIVNRGKTSGYSRNGSFSLDIDGRLVDVNGNKLQGWQADVDGKLTTTGICTDVKIPLGQLTTAKATENLAITGNLDGSQDVYDAGPPATGGIFTTEMTVFDSLGKSHQVSMTFKKVTPGAGVASKWSWDARIGATDVGSGVLAYKTDGTFDADNSTAEPKLDFTPGEGAADMEIDLDFSSTAQLATSGEYSIITQSQDGFGAGTLQSFNVDNSGVITGSFTNGMEKTIGQIALAGFLNPEGLERGEGGIYKETSNSGAAQIGAPNTGLRGTIEDKALELSNVDLSREFTKMIIAQRAFQANSKIVNVMDEIMQEMANLKR